jgi:CubicO group peptidase (beta-lactamase class C family)
MLRLIIAGLAAALAAQAVPTGDPAARVIAVYRQRIEQAGIVGSSLMFVKNGAVTLKHTVGYQDLATKRPVDEETIFHWASITKTLTGVAIMQLRDRGHFTLDDPAVKYVPELRQVHNPFGDISQVTIRQLMSHSAGFRAGTWPWGGDQPWHPFEPTRWDQVVAMFPYTEILFRPGTKYSYSNPGVIFLGRIIELFSGDDYEVYINKNIFMPLGMTHSFFDRAPYHLVAHRSHSFVRNDQGLKEQRFDFDTGITVSNGGLNAPLGDMTKWLSFLIDGNDAILARASLDEMFTPQIRATDGEGGSGADVQAGLSSFIERHPSKASPTGTIELIGHSGDQNGFISHLYLHKPTRSGYVVSFNTDTTSTRDHEKTTRAADDALRDAIIRELFQPAGPK